MNRNQRIVVSIVGIIIVTLALIGITYAYFMTKIIGNSTSKSISGTLADLELTYYDGNGVIAPDDLMMPGDKLEKTFSVKNTGTVKIENYAVVFENVTNTLTRKGDLVYTLTCTSDDDNPCNGVKGASFPSTNSPIILNSIEPTVTHSYTLTVTYKNLDNIDQTEDMGKTFSAKVNIKDGKNTTSEFPYLLANNILNNAKSGINGTTYRETPLTRPGIDSSDISTEAIDEFEHSVSVYATDYYVYGDDYTFDRVKGLYTLTNPKIVPGSGAASILKGKYIQNIYGGPNGNPSNWANNFGMIYKVSSITSSSMYYITYSLRSSYATAESTLSKINDDYGTSYYYRGGVKDNYIDFANMCWRVVRVEGDGSTKIVLEDSTKKCENSWSNNATIRGDLNDFLNTNLSSYKSYLKQDSWKNSNGSSFKYTMKNYMRDRSINVSLLNQSNGNSGLIGNLTVEEVALAGFVTSGETKTSYLYIGSESWYTSYHGDWTTLCVSDEINSYCDGVSRPAVTLKKDVAVSGQGTKSDPYVVQ